jgi:hypothetical protein
MKTITEMSLYDLMAEDLTIWMCPNERFGYDLYLDDENDKILVAEEGIHPHAAESFAEFCRRYLISYEKATKRMAA